MLLQRIYVCKTCNQETIKAEKNPSNPGSYFSDLPKSVVCKYNDCEGIAIHKNDKVFREE